MGTLVADQWIVTASHCTPPNATLTAFLHWIDIDDLSEVVVVGVSEIRLLPNSGFPVYDIALLKLASPLSLSDELYPACLVGPDFQYQAGNAVVTACRMGLLEFV